LWGELGPAFKGRGHGDVWEMDKREVKKEGMTRAGSTEMGEGKDSFFIHSNEDSRRKK